MTRLAPPLAVTLSVLVILAAAWDIRSRRIPNVLVVAGFLTGLAMRTGMNGWMGLKTSLLGFGLGLLIFLPIFLLSGMGGGDVKLMAAIGSIAGPSNTFVIFILTAILGGVLAVGLLVWKGGMMRALENCRFILTELMRLRAPHRRNAELSLDHADSPRLPYGVPIAAGALLFLAL